MAFLPVPKLLKWEYSLSQKYTCPESVLITSGCSFTSSTLQLDTAASWPGFVVDRCRFNYCIDYSFPGAGNEYIGAVSASNIPDTTGIHGRILEAPGGPSELQRESVFHLPLNRHCTDP